MSSLDASHRYFHRYFQFSEESDDIMREKKKIKYMLLIFPRVYAFNCFPTWEPNNPPPPPKKKKKKLAEASNGKKIP